eukprot:scaffold27511_cov199-Amphora_coffeaeformis.AAC.6
MTVVSQLSPRSTTDPPVWLCATLCKSFRHGTLLRAKQLIQYRNAWSTLRDQLIRRVPDMHVMRVCRRTQRRPCKIPVRNWI